METELDRFGRELSHRVDWLLGELHRLKTENERLLRENSELREAPQVRLHADTGCETAVELPIDLVTAVLPGRELSLEAVHFYRQLPQKVNVADFFGCADTAELSASRARALMLALLRQGLVRQQGRFLAKCGAT
jgi:hypothetical protein